MQKNGLHKTKVLLTDGNYKHTWAAARNLDSFGYEVDVIGGNRSISSKSKYVNKNVFSKNLLIKENIQSFLKLIEDEHYDLIIGIGASSIQFLSENARLISKITKLILPPQKSLELCLNKDLTMEFAKKIKIEIPQTFVVENFKELQETIRNITFPIIIKSASETMKDLPTIYLDTRESLVFSKLEALFKKGNKYLIQQRIFGHGEAFFAVYDKGELIDFMMHERLREYPLTGGPSTKAKTIYREDLLRAGKKLLDELDWHGVAMVEFKRDKNDKLFLMEINPKFWGSLDLSLASGVNFPMLAAQISLGKKLLPLAYHANETTFQWPIDGDLKLGITSPKLLPKIVGDLFNPKVKKNIYMKDLSPTLNTILNNFANLLLRQRLFLHLSTLAHKINREGLKFGVIRWFTELTGVPNLKYSRITKSLYVGGKLSKIGTLFLRLNGFNSILNLRSEFDDKKLGIDSFNYFHIRCEEFQPILKQDFQTGVGFIYQELKNSRKIYVHCAEGISRAPSFAAAYFISQGQTLESALSSIKGKRPFINILDGQINSLREFEKSYRRNKY